ncbi:MAG: tyrosine-type recombinase/integrase, partial [Bdellovibrionales bacterium]|nr:tyrosine-type recombinase/integrase [Bdellovibrionales bacterium]
IKLAKKFSPVLLYPIFLLTKETAAKTSDLESLLWKDLNLKNRQLILKASKELVDRKFEISEELVNALSRIERVSPFVFTNLEGNPIKKHILNRELKRFQRKARIDTSWCLRDLRASFAANFLRAGGTIKELQKTLGHVRPYQTEETYGRFKVQNAGVLFDLAAVQETRAVSTSVTKF